MLAEKEELIDDELDMEFPNFKFEYIEKYKRKRTYSKKECIEKINRPTTSKYYKKQSNKKIRRFKGELPKKGNKSFILYDYWWKIY